MPSTYVWIASLAVAALLSGSVSFLIARYHLAPDSYCKLQQTESEECPFYVLNVEPTAKNELLVKRKNFPLVVMLDFIVLLFQLNASVCVSVLSCKRLQLLEQTLTTVLTHMENFEPPSITYQLVWLDNSGDIPAAQAFSRKFQFEKMALLAVLHSF